LTTRLGPLRPAVLPPASVRLSSLLDTIRRIGKGHGIRVGLLRAEAAGKCPNAAVRPVWVMPLSRVVENSTRAPRASDVVIIDEASQRTLWPGRSLFGKTVLVVGDHEQVSPSAVGQDLASSRTSSSSTLPGIPNSDLYDGQISIYDLARQSFGGTIAWSNISARPGNHPVQQFDFLRLPHKTFARCQPRSAPSSHHRLSCFRLQP